MLAVVCSILVAASLGAGYLVGGSQGKTFSTTSILTYTQNVVSTTTVQSVSNYTSTLPQKTSIITSLTTTTITSTLTITSTPTASSSTTNFVARRGITNPAGLQLDVSLNTTSMKSGQGIQVSVAMANELSNQNQVTSANSWPLVGLTDGGCGTTIYPMGLEILRGTNLSAASSSYLSWFRPGPYSCPEEPSTGYQSYVFKANSQWALPASATNTSQFYPMNATIQASGYWTWNGVDPNTAVHHPFESGVYTVAVGDEWGDFTIQFTVT
jgi:hypothetical protein